MNFENLAGNLKNRALRQTLKERKPHPKMYSFTQRPSDKSLKYATEFVPSARKVKVVHGPRISPNRSLHLACACVPANPFRLCLRLLTECDEPRLASQGRRSVPARHLRLLSSPAIHPKKKSCESLGKKFRPVHPSPGGKGCFREGQGQMVHAIRPDRPVINSDLTCCYPFGPGGIRICVKSRLRRGWTQRVRFATSAPTFPISNILRSWKESLGRAGQIREKT